MTEGDSTLVVQRAPLSVRLPENLLVRLAELAAERGVTRNRLIVLLLEDRLEEVPAGGGLSRGDLAGVEERLARLEDLVQEVWERRGTPKPPVGVGEESQDPSGFF
jgi:hypothetical protein